jgi:hypothetical protein
MPGLNMRVASAFRPVPCVCSARSLDEVEDGHFCSI